VSRLGIAAKIITAVASRCWPSADQPLLSGEGSVYPLRLRLEDHQTDEVFVITEVLASYTSSRS
jgi:hypothetical protein